MLENNNFIISQSLLMNPLRLDTRWHLVSSSLYTHRVYLGLSCHITEGLHLQNNIMGSIKMTVSRSKCWCTTLRIWDLDLNQGHHKLHVRLSYTYVVLVFTKGLSSFRTDGFHLGLHVIFTLVSMLMLLHEQSYLDLSEVSVRACHMYNCSIFYALTWVNACGCSGDCNYAWYVH